jgi:hypothetical protein
MSQGAELIHLPAVSSDLMSFIEFVEQAREDIRRSFVVPPHLLVSQELSTAQKVQMIWRERARLLR